ncbi:vitamin B12 dependent-methionine synthase activation domain-containing protein [Chloroflexota bacterium]
MIALDNRIEVDSQQVLSSIGYDIDCQPPSRIESLVNEYADNARHLIEPSYSCVIRDIEWVQGSVSFIEGSVIFKSRVVARLLEQCQKVAVFALTIGNRLEEMVNQLAGDKLMLQAAVLDAIGSEVTEKVAGYVHDKVVGRAAADGGLFISRRFSPGYCDWNVGQQRMLFWALSGKEISVRLTGRGLMIPQKSISGIIGIGGRRDAIEGYNPCRECTKIECPGRR